MELDRQDMARIRASFATLREKYEPGSTTLYDKLFARDAGLKDMFRDDIAGQGMKFLSTLGTIVEVLDDPQALEAELARLGEGHGALGVRAPDYVVMGAALADTMRALLGSGFDAETEAAWQKAYDRIAAQMISAAQAG